jgi:hypothetical protein
MCTNSSYVTAFVFRNYINAKVPSGQNSSILPRRYGLLRSSIAGVFRPFAKKSLQFVFVSSGFGLESIAHIELYWHILTVDFSSVQLIRLGAVAPKISGLTSSRDFSSRKDHDLLLLTSKYPLC